jgi:DNA-binding NarL/FixJ family response regulator
MNHRGSGVTEDSSAKYAKERQKFFGFAERRASGFVRKHESLAEVLNAVRCILDGELYLSRKMSALILHKAFRNKHAGTCSVKALSDRELYVFQLLGAGLTSRKVATHLGVSLKTIQSHRKNIKRKLGFRDGAADASCRPICRHAFPCLSLVASGRRAGLALHRSARI